ncbi:MAG TPA: type II secretion system protein GspJ [Anaeromyxobacteraceae bacterium]|nr:type II secretion system protein GspJ [Anaeromyxobacteraceae bacterium]
MRPARGFTLVELMIAAAITAFIGVVIAGSFAQVDRASQIVREQQERYSGVRLALSRMGREVSMAFLSEHYDRSRFRDRPTLFKGQDDQLLFTTMAGTRLYKDAKESDQIVVEYLVERDPATGEEALFRRVKAHLDDEPDRGGRKDLVADHVTKLSLRYWDRKRKEWVREWSTRSTERMNELPPRVKIDLEVQQADGKRETYETQARVAITAPLEF